MELFRGLHVSNISGRERLCIALVSDSTACNVGDAGGANTYNDVNWVIRGEASTTSPWMAVVVIVDSGLAVTPPSSRSLPAVFAAGGRDRIRCCRIATILVVVECGWASLQGCSPQHDVRSCLFHENWADTHGLSPVFPVLRVSLQSC
jgi:hypothetical protein